MNKKNNPSISSNIRDRPSTTMNNKDLGYYLQGVAKYFKTKEEGYFANLFREHWKHTFISLQFCKNLKPPAKRDLIIRKTNLTRKDKDKGKKSLVLDLDETLIHCNTNGGEKSDVTLLIKFPTGEKIDVIFFV